MDVTPEAEYVDSGGNRIAYQVFGRGEPPIVFVAGGPQHLEMRWGEPSVAMAWTQIAEHHRCVHFDRRGFGMSSPTDDLPSFEDEADDVLAVMDAAGIEHAVIDGHLEGGLVAMHFAMKHPERTVALVLESTAARLLKGDDYPHGIEPVLWDAIEDILHRGSVREIAAFMIPSRLDDPHYLDWFGRYWEAWGPPATVAASLGRLRDADLRPMLSRITVPTLVAYREHDPVMPAAAAEDLASRIPGAELVELPGADVGIAQQPGAWLQRIGAFIDRVAPPASAGPVGTTLDLTGDRPVITTDVTDGSHRSGVLRGLQRVLRRK